MNQNSSSNQVIGQQTTAAATTKGCFAYRIDRHFEEVIAYRPDHFAGQGELTARTIAAVATGFRGTDPATGQVVFEIVWLDPLLMAHVALLTLLVVGGASLFRTSQLSGGGRVVAEGLGGRLLSAGSSDPTEKRILNVVEEMSIASGVPVQARST